MKKNIQSILTLVLCMSLFGCDDYLDVKPDRKLVVPSTLTDLQALMSEHDRMNHQIPNVGDISADNFYLTDAQWASLPEEENRNMYIWSNTGHFPRQLNDWSNNYGPVYVANIVLERIATIPRDDANKSKWDDLKGQALYYRGHHFMQAAFAWSLAYDEATADTDLGIPLRMTTDFNVKSTRASVRETYEQIIADLKEAAALLPASRFHPLQPFKASAYGLLARTYLSMREYEKALLYADLCLQLHSTLIDYNILNPTANYPFERFNAEVITEHISWGRSQNLRENRARIVPELYAAYAEEDLRKQVFFRDTGNNTYAFKGSYSNDSPFAGIATDEMYLTRAEASARLGRIEDAMQDLNTLLEKRWKAGTFVPFTADTREEALAIILEERRKQLPQRGVRWMDLKRLNKEGANITLTRTVQGQTYTLPPNDLRYALPLPEDVIELSGMPQNPR